MRGRRPAGPEYVDKLDGSAQSKKRLRMILETVAGRCTVQEACAQLELGEVRFNQLRQEALQGALATMEPKPAGRPRATTAEEEQVQALQRALADKDMELREAQVREEIALALPRRSAADPPEKKTRRRARPGWWKKKKRS
ncbi:MAG TPA: hypothetical protein VGY66_11250 [Gemmataceae bacterium]|jgi:hypothetical protein|nr:hypothetical protein [Gemmataceae bacterium]